MKIYPILLATSLLFAAGASQAEPQRLFDRVDRNGDGLVDFDEFQPPANRPPRMDMDGDGQVNREEVNLWVSEKQATMLEKANTRFSRMDLNGDDIVTQDEAREAIFYRLDKDQDGYLTPEEMKRPGRRHGPKGR